MPPALAMRRGACPTLAKPMATGDGLLSRLRLPGGRLTPGELERLAHLAQAHGNGLVEITARGNLQIRGLTPETAALFSTAVLDHLAVETGLVIDISPLAGEDPAEKIDPRPFAAAIRSGSSPLWPRLAPKLSVVIDAGGQISMASLKADIRLTALAADHWAVTVGNETPQALSSGNAIAFVLETLGKLAALGPAARAVNLSPIPNPTPRQAKPGAVAETHSAIRTYPLRHGTTTGLALPFGSSDAESLVTFARAATQAGVTLLRLAPNHALLADNAPQSLIDTAKELGFITDPGDPRLRVSACAGNEGCRSGHIAARRLAAQYAPLLASGRHLHISGCAKGCAHPAPANLTLVGRADGVGLVIEGRAGDTPAEIMQESGIDAALRRAQEGR